jgi:hypothetical protein
VETASHSPSPFTTLLNFALKQLSLTMKKILTFILAIAFAETAVSQCVFDPTVTGNVMMCPNGSGQLSTQVYDSYQWYKRPIGGTTQPIAGATSQSLSITAFNDAGYYFSVEATEGGCTEMSPEVLVDSWVFLLPTVSHTGDFTIGPNGESIVCDGDTMYLTLMQPYDTNITWYNNGSPIPGATANTLVVTTAGSYTVQGAPTVCPNFIQNVGVNIDVVVINCGTGIDDHSGEKVTLISPATDQLLFVIPAGSEINDVALYDLKGEKVFAAPGNFSGKVNMDIPELEDGIYVCMFKMENGSTVQKKVYVKSE